MQRLRGPQFMEKPQLLALIEDGALTKPMFALDPAPEPQILDPEVGTLAFPHTDSETQPLVAISVQEAAVKADALHPVWSLQAVGMVDT